MKIVTSELFLQTRGNFEVIDITDRVAVELQKSSFQEGQLTVFIPGSTAGITTIEYEPGLVKDFEQFFERIVPQDQNYFHEQAWHDGNGHSHIRSSLLKTQLTIPFQRGKLILGEWQQLIFVEFDNKSRRRHLVLQMIGQ